MPFLCGVMPSYMPDLQLLEGVIFVNLDRNMIQYHANDPLPSFPRAKLDKYMGKLLKDTSQPLPANISLDEKEVRQRFIKFYSKFLKNYKQHMNPSTGFCSMFI